MLLKDSIAGTISTKSTHWDKASSVAAAIATKSSGWDKASGASKAASSAIIYASNASDKAVAGSSNAASIATTVAEKSAAWDGAGTKADAASAKAAAASGAVDTLDATVIKSVPGVGSRAVHDIVYTAASSLLYSYSENAQE